MPGLEAAGILLVLLSVHMSCLRGPSWALL